MHTMNEVNALFLNQKIYVPTEHVNMLEIENEDINIWKKTVYIIETKEDVAVDQLYEELIIKMNTAIKYSTADIKILCLTSHQKIDLLKIKEMYRCELIAIFGNFINSSNAQMTFPLNKLMLIHGIKVIQTNSIQEIATQTQLKNNYWNALKTILL